MDSPLFLELIKQIRFHDNGNQPDVGDDFQSIVIKIVNSFPVPASLSLPYVSHILHEDGQYRINFFNMNPGCIIVEHDHPFDQGISTVIAGSCHVRSLTLLENKRFESYLSVDSNGIKKQGDVTSYGTRQCNIHGLTTKEGACLLNICKKGKASQRHYYLSVEIKNNIMHCKRRPIENSALNPL